MSKTKEEIAAGALYQTRRDTNSLTSRRTGRLLATTPKRSKPPILDFNFPRSSSKSRAGETSERAIETSSYGSTRGLKGVGDASSYFLFKPMGLTNDIGTRASVWPVGPSRFSDCKLWPYVEVALEVPSTYEGNIRVVERIYTIEYNEI